MQALFDGFRNIVNFSGRTRRSTYWKRLFLLIVVFFTLSVLVVPASLALLSLPREGGVSMILGPALLASFLLSISSLTTRRLHDVGRSGWLGLPCLVVWVVDHTMVAIMGQQGDGLEAYNGDLSLYSSLLFGLFVPLFLLLCSFLTQDSQPHENSYGPDPKQGMRTRLPLLPYRDNYQIVMETLFDGFRNIVNFSGRTRRSTYSIFTFGGLLAVGLLANFGLLFGVLVTFILGILLTIPYLIAVLAMTVRRLHDTGYSGWVLLVYGPLSFLIAGSIVGFLGVRAPDMIKRILNLCRLPLLLFLLFRDGQPHENSYGPDPKQEERGVA